MRSLSMHLRRLNFRTFILALCVVYLVMVIMFHSDLQEPGSNTKPDLKRSILPPSGAPPGNNEQDSGNKVHVPAVRLTPPALNPDPRGSNYNGRMPMETPKPLGDLKEVNPKPHGEFPAAVKLDDWALKPLRFGEQFEGDRPSDLRHVSVQDLQTDDRQCLGPDDGTQYEFIPVKDDKLYVFSAYYDTRPNDFDNKGNGTFIRIMSVFRWMGNHPQLKCLFRSTSGQIFQTEVSYYEMCENHGRPFGGFILSCRVPSQFQHQPCSVIVTTPNSPSPPKPVRVLSTEPEPTRHKFAVCIPPIFGSVDHKKLVEFIELSRILGAGQFTFYDFEVSDPVAKVLEYYQGEGVVHIIPWEYPSHLDMTSWYHGQLVSIQDCLYRNMHSAEYLLFNDIDEIMVPHVHNNWLDLVEAMFDPKTQCALQFHGAFFDRNPNTFPGDTELFTMTETRRTKKLSQYRTKCLVRPYAIFEKGIHHISKPILARLVTHRMPEKIAFIHHYRSCLRDFGMNCESHEEDDRLSHYKFLLLSKVRKTLSML